MSPFLSNSIFAGQRNKIDVCLKFCLMLIKAVCGDIAQVKNVILKRRVEDFFSDINIYSQDWVKA